jgi:AcrR family transcriptional regulator
MTKGEETRQFIIERSAPIFNKKGIAATAMSDIMDATRLSKGSLYVHFENKDVLANAALEYNLEMLGRKVNAALGQHTNARDKLFAYIDVFSDPVNPPVTGGCPMMNFGMEADDNDPQVKEKVNQMVELSQQMVIDIAKEGIKEGVFKAEWKYEDFATVMFAMIEGGIMICRIAGNSSKMRVINRTLKKMITEQLR